MQDMRFRLRVRYKKDGRLRFIGHLDLIRIIERSIRRANLPFVISEGFTPRMKISFSSALALGAASKSEYYDLLLNNYVAFEKALSSLVLSTPKDLCPLDASYVDVKSPALDKWLNTSLWSVEIHGEIDCDNILDSLDSLCASGSISYMRGKKEKTIDLTRTLISYDASNIEEGAHLEFITFSDERASLRPDVLLSFLFEDFDDITYSIMREHQEHVER